MGKLSQAVADGEGISFVVEVADALGARTAQEQGADALAASTDASGLRFAGSLPFLHLGDASAAQEADADAVVVPADLAAWDTAHALGLECVVRVEEPSDVERALQLLDPEVFLLSAPAGEADPLPVLLELLQDVPAGKLAIAVLRDAHPDDVAELERSGVDGVLVSVSGLGSLIAQGPPER